MSFQAIVVGTDGSETAKKAVEQAADLAKQTSGDLHIVMAAAAVPESRLRSERAGVPDDVAHTVNPNEDTEADLKAAAEPYQDSGIKVHTHAKSGDPADAIIDVAESNGADLIVVGNKGMTGAKRFLLGSVPNKVSHHAPCSVLIIRTI
jgi:nucleotide-binding universal stress UspA family protein